jgi:hypothetical protein
MKLLQRLLQRACSHRFTWPRVDAFGRHYQVCLHCGAAYEYDWSGMRQTGRLEPLPSAAIDVNVPDKSAGWNWR